MFTLETFPVHKDLRSDHSQCVDSLSTSIGGNKRKGLTFWDHLGWDYQQLQPLGEAPNQPARGNTDRVNDAVEEGETMVSRKSKEERKSGTWQFWGGE